LLSLTRQFAAATKIPTDVRVEGGTGRLLFGSPSRLAAELSAALQILDEIDPDPWEYAFFHQAAAGMAAALGNIDLARQEAPIALGMG
jgi:hypothetical protein